MVTQAADRKILAIAAALALCAMPRAQATGPYADLESAVEMIGKGKAAEAEHVLVALTDVIPESASMWYSLALARHMQGKRADGIAAIKEAIARNDAYFEAHLLAGRLYAQGLTDPARLVQPEGDHKTAIVHLEKAIELSKDAPEVLRESLGIMVRLRGFDPAMKVLARLRKITPEDTELLWLQAELALGTGQPKDAVDAYRALLAKDPKNPETMEALGNAQLAADRPDDALKTYEQLLEVNPSNNRVRLRRIALMEKAGADPEKIRIQKLYVKYYARAVPHDSKQEAGKKNKKRGASRRKTARPPR